MAERSLIRNPNLSIRQSRSAPVIGRAWVEGQKRTAGISAFGSTEAEAIANLKEQLENL